MGSYAVLLLVAKLFFTDAGMILGLIKLQNLAV
jgi:hypothetical protein